MTVTAVETSTTALKQGDTVRVANDATDDQGYGVAPRLLGKLGKLDFLNDYSGWYVRSDGEVGAYVAARFLTKVTEESAEADTLRDEVAALKVKLETADSATRVARTALSNFQAKVLQAMTEASEEEDDTDTTELLNGILESVGLDRITREFEIEVSFRGSYTTTVMATDEDAAREEINVSMIAEEFANSGYPAGIIDSYDLEVQ